MRPDEKPAPQPQPDPLPPAEHKKAVEQEEKQQRNRLDPRPTLEGELPQTHTSVD